jgi:hypothetical protein
MNREAVPRSELSRGFGPQTTPKIAPPSDPLKEDHMFESWMVRGEVPGGGEGDDGGGDGGNGGGGTGGDEEGTEPA